jgi:hypothetical protein
VKIFPIAVFLLFACVNLSFADNYSDITRRIDLGAGVCAYGDALGANTSIGFTQSLDGWFRWLIPSFKTGLTNLELGFLVNMDIVPVSFYLYALTFDITAGWRFSFGRLNLTPFAAVGLPFTVVGSGSSAIPFIGAATSIGGRISWSFTREFEAGISAEYRADWSGLYIGSVGAFGFIGMRI